MFTNIKDNNPPIDRLLTGDRLELPAIVNPKRPQPLYTPNFHHQSIFQCGESLRSSPLTSLDFVQVISEVSFCTFQHEGFAFFMWFHLLAFLVEAGFAKGPFFDSFYLFLWWLYRGHFSRKPWEVNRETQVTKSTASTWAPVGIGMNLVTTSSRKKKTIPHWCGMCSTWNCRICSFGFPGSAGVPHGFFRAHGFYRCRTLILSLGSSYPWEYKAPLREKWWSHATQILGIQVHFYILQ